MKWIKTDIDVTRYRSEDISGFLIDNGCYGVIIIDPCEINEYVETLDINEYVDSSLVPDDLEAGIRITCYFPNTRDHDLITGRLYEEFGDHIIKISHEEVFDEDWADNWKKYYSEFDIGNNITIRPAWIKETVKSDRKVVLMDPQMAFGSGEHETTYMCIEIIDSMELSEKRVLDIGTGSGILSIVAAKLGADSITAIDIDQIAVRTAEENAVSNCVHDKINIMQIEVGELDEDDYDIIVANIVSDVLIDICGVIKSKLKASGLVVLSGIISDKSEIVKEKYISEGFSFFSEKRKNEWSAMVFYA